MPKLFEEREFELINRLRVEANWDEGEKQQTAVANPAKGWVILETIVHVHTSNGGSRTISTIAGGLELETFESYKSHYDDLLNMIGKYDKNDGKATEVKAKLELLKKQHTESYLKYSSNMNTVKATVSAKSGGNFVDRKRGWEEISVVCRCMYIGLLDKFETIMHIGESNNPDFSQLQLANTSHSQTNSAKIEHSTIQATAGNFKSWFLRYNNNAAIKKDGSYDVSNNLELTKQKCSGSSWKITPENEFCTIQAEEGNFKDWYLDFDDKAPVKKEGNSDVCENLGLTKQKCSGALWKITPDVDQTYTIQATAGNFKGWFLDFNGKAPVKTESGTESSSNLELTKQKCPGVLWKK